jgi:protein TonB
MADGSISGLAITQSSGKPAIDAAALKVVRSAAPFPPIPADAGRKSWKMTVPMTFKGGN